MMPAFTHAINADLFRQLFTMDIVDACIALSPKPPPRP
ncbi:hypothetical protein BLL52_2248 [Rhodoferax antarcticus ANT.BR]|uniref:Uncharacterized protein n=1 Tax=Rhodoferax antarcticus ANT.BR TaxID=1111071 RepID=A0A1Q8YD94_9BURK|nr:hypothetical protein BLL52_2248 [Rhodoferax antarcticus ANT.BR]